MEKEIRKLKIMKGRTMKNVLNKSRKFGYALLGNAVCFMGSAFATGSALIPISTAGATDLGTDGAGGWLMNLLVKWMLPIAIVSINMVGLWVMASGLFNGYRESQREQKFEPMKQAIILAVALFAGIGLTDWGLLTLLAWGKTHLTG